MSTILIVDGYAIGLAAALRGAGHQVIEGTKAIGEMPEGERIVVRGPDLIPHQLETGDQAKKRAQWKTENNRHRRSW